MDRSLKRREFLNLALGGTLLPLTFKLTGCGSAEPLPASAVRSDNSTNYTTVTDIQLRLGLRNGVLKAADIVAGNEVTLYYDEGGHKHGFTVTKTEYEKIIAGQVVRVETERAQGHTHTITIDPENNPPGADSVDVPVEEEAQFFAALSQQENPDLYVAADKELTENSAMYCTETVATCDADESAWQALSPTEEVSGVKAYKTAPLTLSDGGTISLKARYGDNQLLKKVLKFTKKS